MSCCLSGARCRGRLSWTSLGVSSCYFPADRTVSALTGVTDLFFFSSRRRHTRYWRDWSSDVCSSDLGEQSLPKRMAMAARVPGAELIPDTAQLFLGFTSSQRATMGPGRIANLETLPGLTDQHPGGYFRGGTAMHVSHIFEDLEAWFLNFDFDERVRTMIRPDIRVPAGRQTLEPGLEDGADTEVVKRDAEQPGGFGPSASIQTASPLQEGVIGTDGATCPKRTSTP